MPNQHQHDLRLELQILHPAVDALIILRLQKPRAEKILQGGVEAAIGLGHIVLGLARHHGFLEVEIAVRRRIVAGAAQHAHALPIGEGVAGDRGNRRFLHRMIAQPQAVDIDLHIISRRAEHIFLDKQVFHRRYVKHGKPVCKRTHRHNTNPLSFPNNKGFCVIPMKGKKRPEG